MLQRMKDNANGTISKLIVGLITLGFVFVGFESFWGGNSGGQVVAEVDDQSLTRYEYARALSISEHRQRIENPDIDPATFENEAFKNRVLEELIQQKIEESQVGRLNLAVSPSLIDSRIRNMPALQKNGEYDPEYARLVIERNNLSLVEFKSDLATELNLEQLDQMNALANFMTNKEQKELLALYSETRTVNFVSLSADKILGKVSIDEDEIKAFYEKNSQQYMTEEMFRFSYVILDGNQLKNQTQISQAELIKAYRNYKVEKEAEGGEKFVSHILLESKESAEKLLASLESNNFAELALAHSKDTTSKSEGGALGLHSEGFMGDDFDNVVAELGAGEVYPEPVKTEFGWHLIKVTDLNLPDIKSFNEMKGELKAELISEHVKNTLADSKRRLEELAFESEDLTEIQKELGLEILKTSWLNSSTTDPIFNQEKVARVVFSKDVLEGFNSEVIQLDDAQSMVVHIDQRQASTLKPLSEVKDQVRKEVARSHIQEGLMEEAKKLRALAVEKQSLKVAAEKLGYALEERSIGRGISAFSPSVVKDIFKANPNDKSELSLFEDVRDDAIDIINLVQVNPMNEDPLQQHQLARILEMQEGMLKSEIYRQALKTRSDINLYKN